MKGTIELYSGPDHIATIQYTGDSIRGAYTISGDGKGVVQDALIHLPPLRTSMFNATETSGNPEWLCMAAYAITTGDNRVATKAMFDFPEITEEQFQADLQKHIQASNDPTVLPFVGLSRGPVIESVNNKRARRAGMNKQLIERVLEIVEEIERVEEAEFSGYFDEAMNQTKPSPAKLSPEQSAMLTKRATAAFKMFRSEHDLSGKELSLEVMRTVLGAAKRIGLSAEQVAKWLQSAYGSVFVVNSNLVPGVNLKDLNAMAKKTLR